MRLPATPRMRGVEQISPDVASLPRMPRRTPLYDCHVAAGAKLVEFAGWEMPVQYVGVREEHMAVRERCGVFDVSHMGQIETHGPGALALLQRLLSNDVAAIGMGGAQYSVLCRQDGGVLDDLFTYRLANERYLTVTNAANNERDLAWFRACARRLPTREGTGGRDATRDGAATDESGTDEGATDESGTAEGARDEGGTDEGATDESGTAEGARDEGATAGGGGLAVSIEDRLDDYAMLAVQGPRARAIVQGLADDRSRGTLASDEHPRFGQLPARMTTAELRIAGAPMLVCGTGYTGEDGVELLLSPAAAPAVWDALLAAGATPCGLAARDTLRLEACFHLYGADLSETRGPIEAGLGWCCKEDTGFIGAPAVRAVRAAGPAERLVAFAIDGPGIARAGNPIVGGGVVSSGTLSPCLGVGIGLAYVPAERVAVGTRLEIDVRGRLRPALVHAKPFVVKRG